MSKSSFSYAKTVDYGSNSGEYCGEDDCFVSEEARQAYRSAEFRRDLKRSSLIFETLVRRKKGASEDCGEVRGLRVLDMAVGMDELGDECSVRNRESSLATQTNVSGLEVWCVFAVD